MARVCACRYGERGSPAPPGRLAAVPPRGPPERMRNSPQRLPRVDSLKLPLLSYHAIVRGVPYTELSDCELHADGGAMRCAVEVHVLTQRPHQLESAAPGPGVGRWCLPRALVG